MAHLDSQLLFVLEMTGIKLFSILVTLFFVGCRDVSESDKDMIVGSLPAIPFEEVRVDPARCSFEDCVCTVRIPEYVPMNRWAKEKSHVSAFFLEDDDALYTNYARNISNFMSTRMDVDTVLVLGYTDGCGSYDYNKLLSKKRSNVVSDYLRMIGYRGRIFSIGMSEMTSTHSDLAKRADVITTRNLKVRVPPPNLVADHYLLDASGSVRDYSFWVNVIAANRKHNSRLHLSYTKRCLDGTYANQVRPAGYTEIWWSYWQVLDKMKSGETLIILSDFNSRYSLTSNESQLFAEKVKKKGVRVYAVEI